MRVLCIDDDPMTRTLYHRGLGKALPEDDLEVASTGEEGIDMMKACPYEAVITDLEMPGISGLDVVKFIRSQAYPTEVLVVTGKASIDSAVSAMRDGARDYLEKPINIPLLVEKIENIRDYFARLKDSDDQRNAREATEEGASHQIQILEREIQETRQAIDQAIDLVIKEEERIGPDTVSAVRAILTPHGWER